MTYPTLADTVGNTPIVKVGEFEGTQLLLKREGLNPSGALKDRITIEFVREGINKYGRSRRFLDASSGSYAVSLAWACRVLGAKCTVIVNKKISGENLAMLKLLGAEIIEYGSVTAEGRAKCIEMCEAEPDKWIFTDQLTNPAAPGIYQRTMAQEIFRDLPDVSAIIGSVGSGASILGIAREIALNRASVRLFASIANSKNTKGIAGTYLPGPDFKTPFITELEEHGMLADQEPVTFDEAMDWSRQLSHFNIGVQGGGVYAATQRLIKKHDLQGNILMFVGDSQMKNLSRF